MTRTGFLPAFFVMLISVLVAGCASAPANCTPSTMASGAASTTVSGASSDASLREMIVGSWVVPRDSGDYRPAPAREEYRADGTYSLYYFDTPACKNVIGEIDATWQIEQGMLVSVITHVSGGKIYGSLGDVSREQIVAVDGGKMVLHSLNNRLFKFMDSGETYTRQKSDSCLAS